jgi:hypothetical protein
MALKVKEVTSDEVFPRLVATLHESYSKPYNGFWDIFKGRSGEECQTRFAQWHNSDPTSHWIYVEETETGQIIGATQWNIYEKNPYAEAKPPMAAYWIEEGSCSITTDMGTVLKDFLRYGASIHSRLRAE